MDDVLLSAALSGFAHGMADFWPAGLASGPPDPADLARAERLARGEPGAPGTASALSSVYGALSLPARARPAGAHFLPLKPLALDHAALFPAAQPAGDLAALKQEFQASLALAARQYARRDLLLEAALDLALRCAWCVPADGYGPQAGVSRYDHARGVAAVAACLAQDGSRFTLIGGDLSGIQAFIYTLASSGAARSLRARSFYIQLLTDAIARYVLDQLALPISNLLYAGGGGFQILAPGNAMQHLPAVRADVSHRLLIAHKASLGLALEGVPFDAGQFDQFNRVRDDLGRALNTAKRRPFASLAPQDLAPYIGQPIGSGGSEIDFCKVTGEDVPAGQDRSDFVISLEDLGIDLRHATHMAMVDIPRRPPAPAADWQAAVGMFGRSIHLLDAGHPGLDALPADGTVRLARFLPQPEDLPAERRLAQQFAGRDCLAFYYPFARLVPLDAAGNVRLFDELCQASAGLKRWAVLRMDVDNLGALFREGFGDRSSLTQSASLSLSLRLFFEGWLPRLAEPQPGYPGDLRDLLYIQYAGGDDVFVVGAWNAVAEYALRVRESFREYTCGNESLTLSAGIVLADANFPLYQAARMAGDAEDAAKRHVRGDRAKDAVCFLDEVLDWAAFRQAHERAGRLSRWCGNENRAPRSLLQTLQQLHLLANPVSPKTPRKAGTKSLYTRATWLAAYQLTRVAETAAGRKDTDVGAEVSRIQDELMQPQARTNAIALAARWAQYLIR